MFLNHLFIAGHRFAGISILLLMIQPVLSCSKGSEYPEASRSGDYVVVDTGNLSPEIPKYYLFVKEGRKLISL
ncbi:MAG TPA: hypothetical protein VN328_07450 [Thermodesulfovibrionales bacterium]|nr:hypothetical protein [Thermodesulfovibrionales bacterium]